MPSVPATRITAANEQPIRHDRDYILYWMTAARRLGSNFALDRAVEHGRELGRPVLVLEALRCGYRWASDRIHRFVLDGMRDNQHACARAGLGYFPYVEPAAGAGKGLLATLAGSAAVVVTDDFPAFFLPRMTAAAARTIDVRLERVDSNGILPVRAPARSFPTAFAFRRYLQQHIGDALGEIPGTDTLREAAALGDARPAASVTRRYPAAPPALLAGSATALAALPIDHAVAPVALRGGATVARRTLARFVAERLERYAEDRNQPDRPATSGLSAYLHFGHISAHEVVAAVTRNFAWTREDLGRRPSGKRSSFWGLPPPAEAFLDQVLTWRELGYNFCAHHDAHDEFASLPAWARATLDEHRGDRRPYLYRPDELEAARTHDAIWNAAQVELRRDGRMHNYLRMLWGKKVIEWTRSPEQALALLIDLNNKYALDGRDPNSSSGISWCFGRFDRPWGPRRPVFGSIRYMSSDATRKKLDLDRYLRRFAPPSEAP
jgi:deoxyribodipyrimidine photo-lyase